MNNNTTSIILLGLITSVIIIYFVNLHFTINKKVKTRNNKGMTKL